MLQLGIKSDLGQTRVANEDSCLARLVSLEEEAIALLAVADGIGGHRAGDVASRTAIGRLEEEVIGALEQGQAPLVAIEQGVWAANAAVFQLASAEERYRGMGTTLTAALVTEEGLFIAHVGDSRLYLYRDGVCRQLTADHSLVGELVKNGELSPEEARAHPQRNVLTRAVGIESRVKIDLYSESLQLGDIILLASDGLFSLLDDVEIASHLALSKDLQQVADDLVAEANKRGGHDNISVVLARWGCKE
jgi:serine/threonine protein phosphatase PrpC